MTTTRRCHFGRSQIRPYDLSRRLGSDILMLCKLQADERIVESIAQSLVRTIEIQYGVWKNMGKRTHNFGNLSPFQELGLRQLQHGREILS